MGRLLLIEDDRLLRETLCGELRDAGWSVEWAQNTQWGLKYAESGEFDAIAEREGFLLVTPQAIRGVWTVTGFPLGNGADDFGFITALLEELSQQYNIDSTRIYATGMSQGGFLSFDLACSASDTFAAIASVSGVMTPPMAASCSPTRRVPLLQIHGTSDTLIDYQAAQTAVQWWVDFNGANATPESSTLPDLFPEDGTTVERFVYAGGEAGADVEHLKVNGGGHNWPGEDGESDLDASEEIWRFLSRYDSSGRR